MTEASLAHVLKRVESLYQERLRAYALWTGPLPFAGAALAVVPTLISPRGYVLTLAIWAVLWTFRSYHRWKRRCLLEGPIVGVCGRILEVGSHGRGHRRADALVYPLSLEVWFYGQLELARLTVPEAPLGVVAADDQDSLQLKSDHWYRQLERAGLDEPHVFILDLTRRLDVARRHGETFWIEASMQERLRPDQIVGVVVLADRTVAVVLTEDGPSYPRYMPRSDDASAVKAPGA